AGEGRSFGFWPWVSCGNISRAARHGTVSTPATAKNRRDIWRSMVISFAIVELAKTGSYAQLNGRGTRPARAPSSWSKSIKRDTTGGPLRFLVRGRSSFGTRDAPAVPMAEGRGRCSHVTLEDFGEVALIGETGVVGNLNER